MSEGEHPERRPVYINRERMDNILREGVIYQLDRALTALGVADTIAEHESQISPTGYRPLFVTLHHAMADQANLAVTRLYDPSYSRHRTLSIPALLDFMEDQAQWLPVSRPDPAQVLLDDALTEREIEEHPARLTRAMVRHYRQEIPSPDKAQDCLLSMGLDRLKTRRDKQVAHKDADWAFYRPAAWEDVRELVDWGKGFATTVGSVYGLGPYRLTMVDDAADSLERILTALDLST